MPASTMDLMDNALKASLGQKGENLTLKEQLTAGIKKTCLMELEFEEPEAFECTVLNALKAKYVMLKCPELAAKRDEQESDEASKDILKLATRELFPFDKVKLGWSSGLDWVAGAGMVNMGNTCYMNSTLQALFHIPSLVNWLISDRDHALSCQDCIICAMRKTLLETQQRNLTSIRPLLIYNKLRLVCKNLIPGRQEDAHEFLRYLVEAMEKAYIQRFKNHNSFDQKIKETTPLNQILGGYLRSSVRCMRCGHVSTMFQHFQDLLLDIRKVQTLEEALDLYFTRENLDDDTYHCESCQRKVPATKQFSLERAPMALCIQLKRFSISNNKLTKHIGFRSRLDLTKFSRQKYKVPLIYRLVSMVTHMGPTVNCGHYTAVAQGPSGGYFQFDDSMVRSIPHQTVFSTNAYIMLYELEMSPYNLSLEAPIKSKASSTITEPIPSTNNKNGALSNSSSSRTINDKTRDNLPDYSTVKMPKLSVRVGFTSDKVYGPELPPDRLTVTSSSSNGKGKASSSASPSITDESSTESSEDETTKVTTQTRLSKNEADSSTANGETTVTSADELPSSTAYASSPKGGNVKIANKSLSKSLVPYETGDTTGSEDSNNSEDVGTSKSGEWQVTSSTDVATQAKPARNGSFSTATSKNVVNELFKLSSNGYSAPVSTWNGTRSQLDKIVQQEKREDRKRSLADSSSIDQGRAKRPKLSSSCGKDKSNPGYNPVQEYHNTKNWSNGNGSSVNSGYHSKPYHQGNKHKRNFHHKNVFHKNNYRFR